MFGRKWFAFAAAAAVTVPVTSQFPAWAAPSSASLAPGTKMASYDRSGNQVSLCTTGFVVKDSRGYPVLVTAGHCDGGGPLAVRDSADGSWTDFGSFRLNAFTPPFDENSNDIGAVPLTGGPIAFTPALLGQSPVTDAALPRVGQTLCKHGITTGRQCGRVTAVSDRKVFFDAMNRAGDSGGPVYRENGDGTVTAVGVTSARTTNSIICTVDENDNPTQCGGKSIAELITPWMHDWGLFIN